MDGSSELSGSESSGSCCCCGCGGLICIEIYTSWNISRLLVAHAQMKKILMNCLQTWCDQTLFYEIFLKTMDYRVKWQCPGLYKMHFKVFL